MPDIEDGESAEMQGSAKDPYILRNTGGVYSCSCPAWRNQSTPIERRTCKHLRKYRGDAAEQERLGGELSALKPARKPAAAKTSSAGEIGEAAADVPGFLLAHSWDNEVDLTGWWMSEKLDGVRAYWDGKQFISRQGNVFLAPDWFVEDLPADVHLDGELWVARKAFQRTVSIVRRQDRSKDWEEIKFVVFDAPQVKDTFEARMAYLQQFLDELQPKYARPHVQERCQSLQHLREELARVQSHGGEGLMLRQPGSHYEAGRSYSLLKVKTFHDAEAKVLEYLPGTGKHKGRMGALSVEMSNGTRFSIGTGFSDKQRENPPPIGSIVTFRYQELSDGGVPRFPTFVRVRTDIDSLTDSPAPGSTTVVQVTADDGEDAATAPGGENADTASGGSEAATTSGGDEQSGLAAHISMDMLKLALGTAGAPGKPPKKYTSSVKPITPATPSVPEKPSNVLDFAAARKKKMNFAPEDTSEPEAPVHDASKLRYFEFVEGNSSKFWAIWMNDTDVTVRYGRIGSDGQEKTKSFKDIAAAAKYYDSIIDEKIEKGYEEKSGPEDDGNDEEDDLIGDLDSEDDYDSEDSGRDDDWSDDEEDEENDDDDDDDDDDDSEDYNEDFTPDGSVASGYTKYFGEARTAHVNCFCSLCRPSATATVAPLTVATSAPKGNGKAPVGTSPKQSTIASCTPEKSPASVIDSASVRYFEFVDGKSNKFWSIWMDGNEVTVKYGRIGTAGQEKAKSFPDESAARKYYDDIIEEKVDKGYEEREPG